MYDKSKGKMVSFVLDKELLEKVRVFGSKEKMSSTSAALRSIVARYLEGKANTSYDLAQERAV